MENVISQFWNRNRIVLKSFWIGFLVLLLLIPTFLINGLVTERQDREREAVAEISSRWAGAGDGDRSGDRHSLFGFEPGRHDRIITKRWAYFLPEKLHINARIVPETRYRGIYRVIVYTTELQVNCHFDSLHLQELGLSLDKVLLNEAAIFFDLADLQGLQEEVSLHLNTHTGNTDWSLCRAKLPPTSSKMR